MMLQGGLLRWKRPRHTHILFEVEDGLRREDELGNRVWRHQVSLEELGAATSSQPLVVLDMEEKLLDKKPTCVNKSKRSLGRLWSRLRGDQKHSLVSFEGEKL